jgi:Alkylmercury lyase
MSAKGLPLVRSVGGVGGPACCDRAKRLTAAERGLYQWILRAFAEHGSPPLDQLHAVASSLELDVEQALRRLAEEDLVHRGRTDGQIVVAYPFSGVPTPHRVRIGGGSEAYAMCAVDALGIPFMLGESVGINSRDPLSDEEIAVRLEPEGSLDWRPKTAVVLWGGAGTDGPSATACCPFVHFFASSDTARVYLAERPRMTGEILAMPAAAQAGRAIFGDLLTLDGQ